jgi:hypothetical protein
LVMSQIVQRGYLKILIADCFSELILL